jgi:hypothetical protein
VYEKRRAKGIAKAAVQELAHADYIAQFWRRADLTRVACRRIGSKQQEIYTIEQTKRSLCPFDDKRYLLAPPLPDGDPNPETHAFGHYSIPAIVVDGNDERANGEAIQVFDWRERRKLPKLRKDEQPIPRTRVPAVHRRRDGEVAVGEMRAANIEWLAENEPTEGQLQTRHFERAHKLVLKKARSVRPQ